MKSLVSLFFIGAFLMNTCAQAPNESYLFDHKLDEKRSNCIDSELEFNTINVNIKKMGLRVHHLSL